MRLRDGVVAANGVLRWVCAVDACASLAVGVSLCSCLVIYPEKIKEGGRDGKQKITY